MTDSEEKASRPPLAFSMKIDRKVWAGGLGGIVAWALLAGCSSWLHFDLGNYIQPTVTTLSAAFGIVPAPSAQGALAIVFGTLFAYIVPAAYSDIYKRINNRIIALAVTDPSLPAATIPGAKTEIEKLAGPTDSK